MHRNLSDADRRRLEARYEELAHTLAALQASPHDDEATQAQIAQYEREQDEIDYWLDVFSRGD